MKDNSYQPNPRTPITGILPGLRKIHFNLNWASLIHLWSTMSRIC